MADRCLRCNKRIALVNVDKLRGVIGLTQGYVHVRRPFRQHPPVLPEHLR